MQRFPVPKRMVDHVSEERSGERRGGELALSFDRQAISGGRRRNSSIVLSAAGTFLLAAKMCSRETSATDIP